MLFRDVVLIQESLSLKNAKFYLITAIYVSLNILLPLAFHFVPNGGRIFLPIYFFTLVGSYVYGIKVGLLTATVSPILNNLLTGMPKGLMLNVVLLKSVIIAIACSVISNKLKKVSFLSMSFVVLITQVVGFFVEILFIQNIKTSLNNLYLSIPGILIQIVFGKFVISLISNAKKNYN